MGALRGEAAGGSRSRCSSGSSPARCSSALTNLLDVLPARARVRGRDVRHGARQRGVRAQPRTPRGGSRCASSPACSSPASTRPASSSWRRGSATTAGARSASWWARSRSARRRRTSCAASASFAWRDVVLGTLGADARRRAGRLLAVREGPFPFPRARFDPAQAGLVLRDRGVRLACIGYFGHMWELYAMWGWVAVFLADVPRRSRPGSHIAAAAVDVRRHRGRVRGLVVGGRLSDRWGRTRSAALAMVISGACALAIGPRREPAPVVARRCSGTRVGRKRGRRLGAVLDDGHRARRSRLRRHRAHAAARRRLHAHRRDAVAGAGAAGRGRLEWAFALLVPGPVVGIVAMLRLRALPEARRIAGGRG